ncbi:MAG: DUF1156 domain-containing protein, partial [Cyanobacteria bacterium]|nr:DUF1156 domain-containing protein [Cyanobacteriota bacterium]
MPCPKRLIEVDLPIKRISAHARREKSIRHGHISTLHIWWARRPLAACRAVICASLWPDPVDELCPEVFREQATEIITKFAKKAGSTSFTGKLSEESGSHWVAMSKGTVELDAANPKHWNVLRYALLDFIADFANWDNSTHEDYLETSRALTQAAHEALGGEPGTRPLVVDPFAGGGSIPLEALRVGADAFASDLNPVAVLLNKVVLEYIPKYGQRLADEVRKWEKWVKEEAEKELAEFYPKDPDGSTPVAYLWARTIQCEGPGCGIEIPLMRSLWLAKKGKRRIALQLQPDSKNKKTKVQILENISPKDVAPGTIKKVAVTCPDCGFTTPLASVRRQLKEKRGGGETAQLMAVVIDKNDKSSRHYRLPVPEDFEANEKAKIYLKEKTKDNQRFIPNEEIPYEKVWKNSSIRVHLYGMKEWGDLFTSRQALSLSILAEKISNLENVCGLEKDLKEAVQACLALILDRQADYGSTLCSWASSGEFICHTFGRQSIPMVWDFVELNPFSRTGWSGASDWVMRVIKSISEGTSQVGYGSVEKASATKSSLPDDSVNCFFSDPPYYDSVLYANLSDYFYVWLKRSLPHLSDFFDTELTPKAEECVVDEAKNKDHLFFEKTIGQAMGEGRRILTPDGIGTVVFAHKSTVGWESILQAIIDNGWIITGSWPIDTERQGRVSAVDQARLQSSIHVVCRPRESPSGSLRSEIGDWRDVLQELPQRIHDWMPRLADEGVVGADAIFACLGPALEIFSRYSSVEKASGEEVTLREYLEYVWGAVSKEALGMIFTDADTTDFEEDARLTAMWLWTLSAGAPPSPLDKGGAAGGGIDDDDTDDTGKPAKSTGYILEYDAARKNA